MSAFDTYPDTKISILKVGGSNQPRRDGGFQPDMFHQLTNGVATRLRLQCLSILLYQEVFKISSSAYTNNQKYNLSTYISIYTKKIYIYMYD